jgi:hypothetical protein
MSPQVESMMHNHISSAQNNYPYINMPYMNQPQMVSGQMPMQQNVQEQNYLCSKNLWNWIFIIVLIIIIIYVIYLIYKKRSRS